MCFRGAHSQLEMNEIVFPNINVLVSFKYHLRGNILHSSVRIFIHVYYTHPSQFHFQLINVLSSLSF